MKKRLTKEEFIERSLKLNRDKYDYSNVEYINMHKKVKIKCKEHNFFFQQSPVNHLKGQSSCKKCKLKNKIIEKENYLKKQGQIFYEKMTLKFEKKFDYSRAKYKGKNIPIEIICPIHGPF